MLTTKS